MYPPGYGPFVPTTSAPGNDSLNYYQPWIQKSRVWTVFVAIAVAFIAGAVVGNSVPVMIVLLENGGKFENVQALTEAILNGILHQPTILLSAGAGTQAMLLVTVLSAAILSPVPLVRRLRLNPSTLSPLGYILAPIGALAISVLFSNLANLFGIHESGTLKLIGDAFKKMTRTEFAFAILIIGIAPAFAEEFLFRGYAQTRLVQRWGRWPAIWITAALFGIMHMDPLQSPFTFAFGIYLGYLAERSGSIRPTMLCHAVNNSLMVVLGWLGGQSAAEPTRKQATIMAVVAVVVLVLCCLYIRYRVHPPATRDEPPPPVGGILTALLPAPPSVPA
jgi:membrane protease YdiL (CAAX protease family)